MSPITPPSCRRGLSLLLVLLFLFAEVLRVGAALWFVQRNRQQGVEHEFADSELYWKLALRLAAGEPFDDGKRQVLRTPGYPLFLAGSIHLFGPSITGARHAQAAVGSLSCVLLFLLIRKLLDSRAAWFAGVLATIYPFAVFLSAVLLSEAIFSTVLLAQLLCLTSVLESFKTRASANRSLIWSALAGLCGASATLVRPSWILFTPLVAIAFAAPRIGRQTGQPRWPDKNHEASTAPPDSKKFVRCASAAWVMLLAFAVGMFPWWVRNWNVTGHFVPTTLWVGASLYDGLNERASGASNMEFMNEPVQFGLDPSLGEMNEWEQDLYLRAKAGEFAASHPLRVFELAAIKFIRFWNPMPNAAEWQSWPLRLVSLFTCGPVLLLAVLGAWRLRNRRQVLALLAGPVIYFSAIHLVFVSSIRYREAAMLPVLGLVAAALCPGAERKHQPPTAS